MNNRYAVLLFLVSSIALYAMEDNHNYVTESQPLPDWQRMYSTVEAKCHEKFKNRLQEYKKNHYPFATEWKMDSLVDIGKDITKQDDLTLKAAICVTSDEDGNTFLHYAAEKNDEPTVQWILSLNRDNYCLEKRKNGQTPFDICVKKLLPHVDEEQKVTARKIFDMMLTYIACCTMSAEQKSGCLAQVVGLQLRYVCAGSEFAVKQYLLQKLIPTNSSLSYYYKQAHDEHGFTFARALLNNPDKLSTLIEHDYVSFEKDEHGLSVLDYAIKNLEAYTENEDQMTLDPEGFQRASDSMHLLLTYAQKLDLVSEVL